MTTKRRKTIPLIVKLQVVLRELGYTIEEVDFDHFPALALRNWDEATNDTDPPANHPDFIRVLTKGAHKVKTFGPGGEKRITSAGGDIHAIAHERRATDKELAFRRRLLAKANGEPKPKSKWPPRKLRGQSFAEQRGRRSS